MTKRVGIPTTVEIADIRTCQEKQVIDSQNRLPRSHDCDWPVDQLPKEDAMTQTSATQKHNQAAEKNIVRPFHVNVRLTVIVALGLVVLAGVAIAAQDKYTVKVPG